MNYSADPQDNIILATAIAGDADFIVTSDKRHLLSLDAVAGIKIVTARQVIENLS